MTKADMLAADCHAVSGVQAKFLGQRDKMRCFPEKWLKKLNTSASKRKLIQ
jgi:hypothetical protein